MTKVFLIRHGETEWNREDIFRGRADVPLNSVGRCQAESIAAVLKSLELVNPVFFCSPLKRSRETAEIAASYLATAEVVNDPAFIDICFGQWEGKSLQEVEEEYPLLFKTWVEEPGKVVFPAGESLDTVAERSEKGLYRAVKNNLDRELVIVSHRAVNKALLCRLLSLTQQSFWKIRQDTACLNELDYDYGNFTIVRLNDICHLRSLKRAEKDF